MKQIKLILFLAGALGTLSCRAMERVLTQVVNESPANMHLLLIPFKDPLYELQFATACETTIKGRLVYVPTGETLTLKTPLKIRLKEENNDQEFCLAYGSEVIYLSQDHMKPEDRSVLLLISKECEMSLVPRKTTLRESPLDRAKSLDRE